MLAALLLRTRNRCFSLQQRARLHGRSSASATAAANFQHPATQQKLEWIETVSPWTLDDLLANPPSLAASTRRLASRLAWMRAAGLEPPCTPAALASYSDAVFESLLRDEASKGSNSESAPVLGEGGWEGWVEEWLQHEEGKRWGFLPQADDSSQEE